MNHKLFDDVLNNIFNEDIRKFAIACLEKAPKYLEEIPTSSTGKYHPAECNAKGGLVIHIRRTCYFANIFISMNDWKQRIEGDILLASLLLHDLGKKDSYTGKGWEYVKHPQIAADSLKEFMHLLPPSVFQAIYNCVFYHMSLWTEKSYRKDIKKYTLLELLTAQCDMLASQKELDVK